VQKGAFEEASFLAKQTSTNTTNDLRSSARFDKKNMGSSGNYGGYYGISPCHLSEEFGGFAKNPMA